MKTLYYSLRKVSQLTGLSPELIKELESKAPEELAPVENAAGNPLYAPEQVKALKKLAKQHLGKPTPSPEQESQKPVAKEAQPDSPPKNTPPPSFTVRPAKMARHLHPLHRKQPPGRLASSGVRPPRSDETKEEKTGDKQASEPRPVPASKRRHERPDNAPVSRTDSKNTDSTASQTDASYKFRAAISNLKSYRNKQQENAGAQKLPETLSKLGGTSNFTSDLREIRDILQELHDRL